jgi:hypothetical protein
VVLGDAPQDHPHEHRVADHEALCCNDPVALSAAFPPQLPAVRSLGARSGVPLSGRGSRARPVRTRGRQPLRQSSVTTSNRPAATHSRPAGRSATGTDCRTARGRFASAASTRSRQLDSRPESGCTCLCRGLAPTAVRSADRSGRDERVGDCEPFARRGACRELRNHDHPLVGDRRGDGPGVVPDEHNGFETEGAREQPQ